MLHCLHMQNALILMGGGSHTFPKNCWNFLQAWLLGQIQEKMKCVFQLPEEIQTLLFKFVFCHVPRLFYMWDQFLCSLSVLGNCLCPASASSLSLIWIQVKFLLARGLSYIVLTVLLYCVWSYPWIMKRFAFAKLLKFSFNEQNLFSISA